MRQVDDYVAIDNDRLSVNLSSLQNAQSISPDIAMEPKILLGSSFAIKVAGKDITLTKFAAMYPGGATEPNKDIVATLEHLSVASATIGTIGSNSITFAVTADSYEAITSAYKQARAGRQMLTVEVTFATDSLVTGQFYFKPASGNTEGKWGDILTFKTEVTFISTSEPVIQLVGGGSDSSNAIGLITLNNIRASNNFDVSLTTENSSDSAKVVTSILANNTSK
ncbi:hypothetical protein [Francisella sp. TX07-6608]|uniref:hypothetical protein n=1 Tax=Francisella sp. TX07-6608 TaxID=573568 RepID=UPI0008F9CB57|nr:hypothetical protein [Francisella sp. TX07-6608]OIN83453.1 hypothetical protein KX00_267 [Francisella sp. TX07-6608]